MKLENLTAEQRKKTYKPTEKREDGVWWKDGAGIDLHESYVYPKERARHKLVHSLGIDALKLHEQLEKIKADFWERISGYLENTGLSLESDASNIPPMYSFDGLFKMEIDEQERSAFTEGLALAKRLVDECIRKWSKDSRPELFQIVQGAFSVDKKGELSVAKVRALLKYDIADEDWQNAMDALRKSFVASTSKRYLRFYVRNAENGYDPIVLQWSAL